MTIEGLLMMLKEVTADLNERWIDYLENNETPIDEKSAGALSHLVNEAIAPGFLRILKGNKGVLK